MEELEELTCGSTLHGFEVLRTEALPETDGDAIIMKHVKSGARLLYLRNDDSNKAFSISFRTPPGNDTGVFHILEHSVLNGSDKFPVKEPFVNLLKTSMQTFLNAMTFSDKTMYPVASTNEKDLLNLMDVYLDAVLHPSIYHKRAIFEQEGWHYELADAEKTAEGAAEGADEAVNAPIEAVAESAEDAADDAVAPRLRFNGVVYNEMKGALSDASSVLYDEVQKALFPTNTYQYESGGDPRAIPQLTYEQFLDEHRRHYRLDNSYLTLYGDVDIDTMLAFLDEHYLSPVADEQAAARAERLAQAADGETACLEPRTIEPQEPVCNLGVVRTMDTAPENACMGLGFVVGPASDRRRVMAVDVLLDAIMGSNEAPLKRALLDARLADEASGFLAEATLQPFAVIELKGLVEDAPARFRDVARQELARLADGGLDHSLVEASLSRYEFVMREREFGMADGVAFAVSALSGWLYDDDAPTDYLRYEDDFAFLRAALDSDYFETLIREVFLDNPHQCEVEIRPETPEGAKDEMVRLAQIEQTMDQSDFERIAAEVEELRRIQAETDSPEALATLPRLLRSDALEAPHEPAYALVDDAPVPCIRHEVPTHGIAYAYRYYDLDCVAFDELPYVKILCMVLGKLGTAKRSAAELDTLINGKLGNLSVFAEAYEDRNDPWKLTSKVAVSASALSKNVDWLAKLPLEVMFTSDFTDTGKIKDVLQQARVSMEQSFAQAGHVAAMSRATSYFQPVGVLREQLGGVDFYLFLKDLLANFDERAEGLSLRLKELALRLFTSDSLIMSFAGSQADYEQFWQQCAGEDVAMGAINTRHESKLVIPEPVRRNEAFIVPTDVCYASQGFDRRLLAGAADYTAAWQVGARALTYDYLWNEVRVRGGAYGVGFQVSRTGVMRYYSYRDPHLDETFARFDAAAEWLQTFQPTAEDLDGYAVSTVAGFDRPLKARMLMRRQDGDYFCGRTPQTRLAARKRMLEADLQALRDLGSALSAANEKDMRCAFGNKDILSGSKSGLQVIDLLNS